MLKYRFECGPLTPNEVGKIAQHIRKMRRKERVRKAWLVMGHIKLFSHSLAYRLCVHVLYSYSVVCCIRDAECRSGEELVSLFGLCDTLQGMHITLIDFTEHNANRIIPSCCHMTVGCRIYLTSVELT